MLNGSHFHTAKPTLHLPVSLLDRELILSCHFRLPPPPCCAGVFAGTLITHNFPHSFLPGIFCLCPWSTKSLVRFGYSFFFFCVFMQFITCSASVLLCCSGLSHCRLSKSIPLTNQRYVLKGICCFFILMSMPLCFVYVFLSCDFFLKYFGF